MDHASLLKQFEHLDPNNQNAFEAKDLELLISTVRVVKPTTESLNVCTGDSSTKSDCEWSILAND